jgi:hypothetical protein
MTTTAKFINRIFVCALFVTAISIPLPSCDKEKISLDTNTPVDQIEAAEKLVIPDAVALPDNLPNGNLRVATYFASGVQKYRADAIPGSNPVALQWVFVAPQADLYDVTNNKVGTHSVGPTWQLSAGDSIYGQEFSPRRNAPGTDATSIDWLLLMPKTGKVATGIFASVAYVQRIATKGGKAPVTPPTNASDVIEVPYTAIYRFTKKNQ